MRLYKEVSDKKPKKPRKKKVKEDEIGEGSAEPAKKKKKEVEVDDEDDEGPREAPGWYVACSSEVDWTDLVAKYKKSKKKQDRELREVLEENFIPEISKMFQEKEKEERIRLMMMNKRSSGRLDRKRAEKEQEYESRRDEEEKREMERRAEEEKRREKEKENKQKGRAHRAQQREEKLHEEVFQVNRRRGGEEGVRVRGSPREVVEEDHDYSRRRGEEGARRRNPALKEWQRLTSTEEQEGKRNLRF